MKIATKNLKPGMNILVKTGHQYFNNIQTSSQLIHSIHHSKKSEVTFESGLVCNFGENTLHVVV